MVIGFNYLSDKFLFLNFSIFPSNNYKNEVILLITSPKGPVDDQVLLVLAQIVCDCEEDCHLIIIGQQRH